MRSQASGLAGRVALPHIGAMQGKPPPTIFDPVRRAAAAARAARWRKTAGEAGFLFDHMAEEAIERLDFMQLAPRRSLVLGPLPPSLRDRLERDGGQVDNPTDRDPEEPYPVPSGGDGYDLAMSLGAIDTANDLPGALIHLHRALAPGGFALAAMIGAPALTHLRRALLAADGERPAARMHPLVDVHSAAQLVQRVGWHSPVVDSHTLSVSYRSFDRLVTDLRLHGLTNVLASRAPALTRAGRERARAAFLDQADGEGRVIEPFEIVMLGGWRR